MSIPEGVSRDEYGFGRRTTPKDNDSIHTKPCWYYRKGTCKWGSGCTFVHEQGDAGQADQSYHKKSYHKTGRVCRHYLRGNCNHGEFCRFDHSPKPIQAAAVQPLVLQQPVPIRRPSVQSDALEQQLPIQTDFVQPPPALEQQLPIRPSSVQSEAFEQPLPIQADAVQPPPDSQQPLPRHPTWQNTAQAVHETQFSVESGDADEMARLAEEITSIDEGIRLLTALMRDKEQKQGRLAALQAKFKQEEAYQNALRAQNEAYQYQQALSQQAAGFQGATPVEEMQPSSGVPVMGYYQVYGVPHNPHDPYAGSYHPYPGAYHPYAGPNNPYVGSYNPYAGPNNPYVGPNNPYAAPYNPYAEEPVSALDPGAPQFRPNG